MKGKLWLTWKKYRNKEGMKTLKEYPAAEKLW